MNELKEFKEFMKIIIRSWYDYKKINQIDREGSRNTIKYQK